MKYGYARVNTYSQKKDSNSLESQRKLLLNEGCTEVFSDVCSGLKTDRPEFIKLLELLKEGDTLVVTKPDRFSRSASNGIKLIDSLLEKVLRSIFLI